MNKNGTGFHTCKESHKIESLRNHTTTDRKEGEQLEDQEALARAAITLETERIRGSNA